LGEKRIISNLMMGKGGTTCSSGMR